MSESHRLTLGIEGMTCSSCSKTIERSLTTLKGVITATVTLSTNCAVVVYETKIISSVEIVDSVESVGFGAAILENVPIKEIENGIKFGLVKFGIEGMTCSSCSSTIENCLRGIHGVTAAEVVLSTAIAQVRFDILQTTVEALRSEIESIGFDAEVLEQALENSASSGEEICQKNLMLTISCLDATVTVSRMEELASELHQLNGVLDVTFSGKVNDLTIKISINEDVIGPRDLVDCGARCYLNMTVTSLGGFMMANRLSLQYQAETRQHLLQVISAVSLTLPILIITMILPMNMASQAMMKLNVVKGLTVDGLVLLLLATPVQFIIGYRFHSKAFKSLKSGTLGMDFLISTGTCAAYLYSFIALIRGIIAGEASDKDVEFFETAAVLISVVIFGKYLETYAKGMTASAIHKLTALRANFARLVVNSDENGTVEGTQAEGDAVQDKVADQLIDGSLVHKKDLLRLVEGESVPADGVLRTGIVGVDESMMTGESRVITKRAGDQLYGGTTVVEGSGVMRVTAVGDKSALGKIVCTVQEAQASKPPIQELADKIARMFVPVVACASGCTFLVWIIAWAAGVVPVHWYATSHGNLAGQAVAFAFFFALAVWVSACPCAFGLATPTAILVATGVAAKHGVLVRRGAALQFTAEIDTIAFDKTGTLTCGKPEVTDGYICDNFGSVMRMPHHVQKTDKLSGGDGENTGMNMKDLLSLFQLLLSVEERSSHPLAKGLTEYAKQQLPLITLAVDRLQMKSHNFGPMNIPTGYSLIEQDSLMDVVAGQGIRFTANSSDSADKIVIIVGSAKLLEGDGVVVSPAAAAVAASLRAGGKVSVFMAVNCQLRAVFGVSDTIRPETYAVLDALRQQNITCYMVTGDHTSTALAIGAAVGIPPECIFANAKPDDKEAFVAALQARGKKTLFVGDGTNDSPALSRASVGIAMAGGTDIAIESGDIVFCKNNLTSLLTIIELSRTTLRRILINYFWALIYNTILIPIAAGVLYPTYGFKLAPMLAGGAMALSSVSIVASSLMLGWFTPPVLYLDKDAKKALSAVSPSSYSQDSLDAEHDDIESRGLVSGELQQCGCPASFSSVMLRPQSNLELMLRVGREAVGLPGSAEYASVPAAAGAASLIWSSTRVLSVDEIMNRSTAFADSSLSEFGRRSSKLLSNPQQVGPMASGILMLDIPLSSGTAGVSLSPTASKDKGSPKGGCACMKHQNQIPPNNGHMVPGSQIYPNTNMYPMSYPINSVNGAYMAQTLPTGMPAYHGPAVVNPPSVPQPTYFDWIPSPDERMQLDKWFNDLDEKAVGVIGGAQAVNFLKNSNLKKESLRSIWALVDTNGTGHIDRTQFYAVVRHVSILCSPIYAGNVPTNERFNKLINDTLPMPLFTAPPVQVEATSVQVPVTSAPLPLHGQSQQSQQCQQYPQLQQQSPSSAVSSNSMAMSYQGGGTQVQGQYSAQLQAPIQYQQYQPAPQQLYQQQQQQQQPGVVGHATVPVMSNQPLPQYGYQQHNATLPQNQPIVYGTSQAHISHTPPVTFPYAAQAIVGDLHQTAVPQVASANNDNDDDFETGDFVDASTAVANTNSTMLKAMAMTSGSVDLACLADLDFGLAPSMHVASEIPSLKVDDANDDDDDGDFGEFTAGVKDGPEAVVSQSAVTGSVPGSPREDASRRMSYFDELVEMDLKADVEDWDDFAEVNTAGALPNSAEDQNNDNVNTSIDATSIHENCTELVKMRDDDFDFGDEFISSPTIVVENSGTESLVHPVPISISDAFDDIADPIANVIVSSFAEPELEVTEEDEEEFESFATFETAAAPVIVTVDLMEEIVPSQLVLTPAVAASPDLLDFMDFSDEPVTTIVTADSQVVEDFGDFGEFETTPSAVDVLAPNIDVGETFEANFDDFEFVEAAMQLQTKDTNMAESLVTDFVAFEEIGGTCEPAADEIVPVHDVQPVHEFVSDFDAFGDVQFEITDKSNSGDLTHLRLVAANRKICHTACDAITTSSTLQLSADQLVVLAVHLGDTFHLYGDAHECAMQATYQRRLVELADEKRIAVDQDDLERAIAIKKEVQEISSKLASQSDVCLWQEIVDHRLVTGQSIDDLVNFISSVDIDAGRHCRQETDAIIKRDSFKTLEDRMLSSCLLANSLTCCAMLHSTHKTLKTQWFAMLGTLAGLLTVAESGLDAFRQLSVIDQSHLISGDSTDPNVVKFSDFVAGTVRLAQLGTDLCQTCRHALVEHSALQGLSALCRDLLTRLQDKAFHAMVDEDISLAMTEREHATKQADTDLTVLGLTRKAVVYSTWNFRPVSFLRHNNKEFKVENKFGDYAALLWENSSLKNSGPLFRIEVC